MDRGGPSLLAAAIIEGSYPGLVYRRDPATFPYGARHDPLFQDYERDITLTIKEVAGKIARDPVGMMRWYLIEKPIYLFQWDNIDGVGDVFVYPVKSSPFRNTTVFQSLHGLFYYAHIPILILAVVGGGLAWFGRSGPLFKSGRPEVLRLSAMLLAFLYAIQIPFVCTARYAVPLLPAIYLLAMFAVVSSSSILLARVGSDRRFPGVPASSR
jgi:hypothetical protein